MELNKIFTMTVASRTSWKAAILVNDIGKCLIVPVFTIYCAFHLILDVNIECMRVFRSFDLQEIKFWHPEDLRFIPALQEGRAD